MRIRRLYHRDVVTIELISELKGGMRVLMQMAALALILVALFELRRDPSELKWLPLAAIGLLCLPFGCGEFVYLITLDGRIRTRARAFGFPIFQVTQLASKFSRVDLIRDEDGEFALQFFDAKGDLAFTLDGIPDEKLALEIVGLVPTANNQQELAVGHAIDELIENNKERSPIFSLLCYLVLFPVAPLVVYLFGGDEVFLLAMILGVCGVARLAYELRRDEGVYRVSRDEGYVDRWRRVGWFQVMDYRHHLGGESVTEVQQMRFSRASLVLPILVIAQAAAIWGGATLHEIRKRQIEEEFSARDEAIFGERAKPSAPALNEEAVQKGAALLLEYKQRKEQQEKEQQEKEAAD